MDDPAIALIVAAIYAAATADQPADDWDALTASTDRPAQTPPLLLTRTS